MVTGRQRPDLAAIRHLILASDKTTQRDVTGSTLRRLWSEKAAGKTLESTVDSGAGAIPAPERAIYFTLAKSASNCMVCPSCNVTITVVLALGSNDSYPNRAVKRDR